MSSSTSPLLLKLFNEDSSRDVAFKLLERGHNVHVCETPDGKVSLAILTRVTPGGAWDVSPGEGHLYLQFAGEELKFPLSTGKEIINKWDSKGNSSSAA